MRERWQEVPLSQVACLSIDRVVPHPGESYRLAGVLNRGHGLLDRGRLLGEETSYAILHRLHRDQLVMRKLTAWEGTLAVVTDQFEDFVVSTEFPTFAVDGSALLSSYMRLLCGMPNLWEQMRARVKGTVQRRKRLSPTELLGVLILLPPLEEQRRIVDLVAAVDEVIEATRVTTETAAESWRAAAALVFDRDAPTARLGEVVGVTMGRQRSPKTAAGEHMVHYLRAANVKDGRLALDDVLRMNFHPHEQETFRLQSGDVLVTEGCGSLKQIGASACWSKELGGTVCFQNTLLRLRAIPGITCAGYVHHLARYAFAAGWWSRISSGTNIFHIGSERAKQLEVPVMSLEEQRRVTGVLDGFADVQDVGIELQERLGALRSAILGDLLSGDHEIPASYDELLTA